MYVSPPDASKLPSVSLIPFGEIKKGSSVILTHRSDANQVNTGGTRRMDNQNLNLSMKNQVSSSAPSCTMTMESFTVQLRMRWVIKVFSSFKVNVY